MTENNFVPSRADYSLEDYILSKDKTKLNNAMDLSLSECIQKMGIAPIADIPITSSCGRFDRRSLRESDGSDEENDEPPVRMATIESDDEMEGETGLNPLTGIKRFETKETLEGIRVRSQNFRLLPENLVDRPAGVKRLAVLPLVGNERYRKFQYGKINKNYRDRTGNYNRMSNSRIGNFFEKGSFTYKVGDRNGDGIEGIIGIERAKHLKPAFNQTTPDQAPVAAPPTCTLNMNWSGFFQGMSNVLGPVCEPAPVSQDNELNTVRMNLLNMLKAKRDQEATLKYNLEYQKEIAEIQNRPLVVNDRGFNPTVMTTDGPGIDNFNQLKPHMTNIPFNVRFS